MASRFAVIADVHSNAVALAAVLDDARDVGVDGLVCLGDIVGTGPEPQRCIDMLEAAQALVLKGNTDQWVLSPDGSDSGSDAERRLDDIDRWSGSCLEPAARAGRGAPPATKGGTP